jgi:hypothetical protein
VAAHAPAPATHPAPVSAAGGTPAAASLVPARASTGVSVSLIRASSIFASPYCAVPVPGTRAS